MKQYLWIESLIVIFFVIMMVCTHDYFAIQQIWCIGFISVAFLAGYLLMTYWKYALDKALKIKEAEEQKLLTEFEQKKAWALFQNELKMREERCALLKEFWKSEAFQKREDVLNQSFEYYKRFMEIEYGLSSQKINETKSE